MDVFIASYSLQRYPRGLGRALQRISFVASLNHYHDISGPWAVSRCRSKNDAPKLGLRIYLEYCYAHGKKDEGAGVVSLTSSPLHCCPFFLLSGTLVVFTSPYRTPTCRSLANDIRSLLCPLRSVSPHERIVIRNEESFLSGGRPCNYPRFLIDSYSTTLFTLLPRPSLPLSLFHCNHRGYQCVSTSRPLFYCNPHLTYSLPRRASLSIRNHVSSSPPLPVYSVECRSSTQYMP